MASAYACVFTTDPATGTNYVLVGKKRVQARWLDWNGADYRVPFQPGNARAVNRVPYNIRNNPDQPVFPGGGIDPAESPTDTAVREFREETGVTLNLATLATAAVVTTFDINGQPAAPLPVNGFAAVYLQYAWADLNTIFQSAFQNLMANNYQPAPATVDDELSFACVLLAADARQWFVNANNAASYRLSTDWFTAIIDHLP